MLNEEKIILMTQMASYEENEGKRTWRSAGIFAATTLRYRY